MAGTKVANTSACYDLSHALGYFCKTVYGSLPVSLHDLGITSEDIMRLSKPQCASKCERIGRFAEEISAKVKQFNYDLCMTVSKNAALQREECHD